MNSASATRGTGSVVPTGTVVYALAGSVLIATLLGLGLAYVAKDYFAEQSQSQISPALTQTHQVVVGAQRYAMPASLLIDPTQRRDGFAERVDMEFALPLGRDGALMDVDITLMPRGRVSPSTGLLDSVYLHQFADAQLSGPPGLVGKPLEADAGTRGETVWYDPLNANPFVAKCMTPVQMNQSERTCMRVMTLTDRNSAIVTFPSAALADWRSFDGTVEAAVAALRI